MPSGHGISTVAMGRSPRLAPASGSSRARAGARGLGLTFVLGFLALAAAPAVAQGLGGVLYYAALDGSVRSVDVDTGGQATPIPSAAFLGANPGIGGEFAFDPPTRLIGSLFEILLTVAP